MANTLSAKSRVRKPAAASTIALGPKFRAKAAITVPTAETGASYCLRLPAARNSSCYACRMVRREIEIDEDTDRILTELASEYKGDVSQALADLVHVYEGLEAFAEQTEAVHPNLLRTLRARSEADFREGRMSSWNDVKSRNEL
jgi:hypothetical protein